MRGDIGEKNSYSKHYPYVKADVLEKHSRFITQEVVNQVKSSFVLTRSGDDQSIVCISAETGKPVCVGCIENGIYMFFCKTLSKILK